MSSWEICEKNCFFFFFCEKHSFIEWIYVEGARWNCLYKAIPICVPTINVIEFKETYFQIYTKQVSRPLAFLF